MLFTDGAQGAWLDPSDPATVFQDAAATIPATTVGDPVGCVLDKSDQGHHAVQPVIANRPTLQVDGEGRAFLRFNGLNTGLTIAAFAALSDKVQIIAGLRKTSDSAIAILAEFGVQMPHGAFYLTAPHTVGPSYGMAVRGHGAIRAFHYADPAVTAPVTSVVSLIGDIAASAIALRVDGAQVAQSALSLDGGSFGTWPLDIGRRGNGTLHLDGDLYGLMLRFGAVQGGNALPRAEQWMATKAGVTL
tara:strand:+ start:340 stop:1077 length:738 start_codon:yes stop_codon:yes gene_type:complete